MSTCIKYPNPPLTPDKLDGDLDIVIVACDHLAKGPLTQQRAELESEGVQLPLVCEGDQLVGVVGLSCEWNIKHVLHV